MKEITLARDGGTLDKVAWVQLLAQRLSVFLALASFDAAKFKGNLSHQCPSRGFSCDASGCLLLPCAIHDRAGPWVKKILFFSLL